MIRTYRLSEAARQWKKHSYHPDNAKVLILDIETAPILAHVWRTFKVHVNLDQIQRDWSILSFSAKWLGDNKVYYFDQQRATNLNDETEVLKHLHALLDEADIVVAHNGRRFDLKKINARFIKLNLPPPSPYKIVDTLEIAKAAFGFTSNKLAYLTEHLNKDYKKLDHGDYPGVQLWEAVLKGDKAAWKSMRKYNEFDVLSLEETYLLLRPWYNKHPNVSAFNPDETTRCPVCGGDHLSRRGYGYSNVGKYQRYRCDDCGAWSRSRYTINSTDKRKALLAS